MITIVMLNWRRPKYVEINVAQYFAYRLVSEILIFSNTGLPLDFTFLPKQPTVISATTDLGLYTRFTTAVLGHNECVMHVDDDLLIPEATVNRLYSAWCENRQVCHSLHGRKVTNGYVRENVYGHVEVVLTRCLMVTRDLCAHALTHVHHFDDLTCEPYGNGEDIILSFTALKRSGQLNRAYHLPYDNHPGYADGESGQDTLSIHKRWNGHEEHRSRLVNRCRAYFGIQAGIVAAQDEHQGHFVETQPK